MGVDMVAKIAIITIIIIVIVSMIRPIVMLFWGILAWHLSFAWHFSANRSSIVIIVSGCSPLWRLMPQNIS